MKNELIQYLETNGLKYTDKDHKVLHQCLSPTHDDKTMSAYTDVINGFTSCSSCGFYKVGVKFLEFLGSEVKVSDMALSRLSFAFTEKEEKKFPVILPPYFRKAGKFRGISEKTMQKVGAYITEPDHFYSKRIIFPLHNFKQELKGFEAVAVLKSMDPKVLRGKGVDTTTFFGFENFIDDREVFLNEGLFSALSFIEKGLSGVFNFGVASIENKLEVFHAKGVKTVWLCGDNDEVGKQFNSESFKILRKDFKVRFWNWPKTLEVKGDSNDLLKAGRFDENIRFNKGDF